MSTLDEFKFPNGYTVGICRKQDIIDCIDENILDKEVTLEIINQLEIDCADNISSGNWSGIPFLGSIRIPKYKQAIKSTENVELIQAARQTLTKEEYKSFRQNLALNINLDIKRDKVNTYRLSMFVKKNKNTFNRYLKKGIELGTKDNEKYALAMCYAAMIMTPLDYEDFINNGTI